MNEKHSVYVQKQFQKYCKLYFFTEIGHCMYLFYLLVGTPVICFLHLYNLYLYNILQFCRAILRVKFERIFQAVLEEFPIMLNCYELDPSFYGPTRSYSLKIAASYQQEVAKYRYRFG